MNNEINLLHSKKRSVLSDLTTKLRILRFSALTLLSIVVLLSMALFFLVIASPLPTLKEQENELLSSVSTNNDLFAQHTLLTNRIRDIESIRNKRMNMRETLRLFREDLPEDVTIQTLAIEENVVRIQAHSLSLESLETYSSSLSQRVVDSKTLSLVQVKSLILADDGFVLDVTATLP